MSREDDIHHVCWCDLETSGLDEKVNPILEIGMIVTDRELTTVFEFESVVTPHDITQTLFDMSEPVREMHKKNDLLNEIMAARGHNILAVQDSILTHLDRLEIKHMILAGSGVGHFDRRFIAEQMPLFARKLTYWAYDVGVVRRFLRSCGVELPAFDQESKTHRAMDDIRLHLAEWKAYTEKVKSWNEMSTHALVDQ